MMLDTSALVAILLGEPEASAMIAAIVSAPSRFVAAPTLVEASAVLFARKGAGGDVALDALLQRLSIVTVPLSLDAASLARGAFRRFGKGVGNPAVLNYGDCLAYGAAKASGLPLLCKGNDFAVTDVELVGY